MNVMYRYANASDYDLIAEVWHASASLPNVGPKTTLETLRARLEPEVMNGWSIAVAERESEVVGFLAIVPERQVLAQLFVHPNFIGSGVGGRLLQIAKREMPSGFSLTTAKTNTDAHKFYLSFGLAMTGAKLHQKTKHEILAFEWNGNEHSLQAYT